MGSGLFLRTDIQTNKQTSAFIIYLLISSFTYYIFSGQSSSSKSDSNVEQASIAPTLPDSTSNGSGASNSSNSSKPATGLLSFLTSWRRNSNGKKNYGKNLFLDPRMHNDYEDGLEMHQFSDSGRIANRYDNMRWDVW